MTTPSLRKWCSTFQAGVNHDPQSCHECQHLAAAVHEALEEARSLLRDLAAWSIEGGCWCRDQYNGSLPMPQQEPDHDWNCRRVRAFVATLKTEAPDA